jgi:hypothetical protein
VGTPGADFCGRAGDCATEVSASASEHRQVVSNVFIVEAVEYRLGSGTISTLSQTV